MREPIPPSLCTCLHLGVMELEAQSPSFIDARTFLGLRFPMAEQLERGWQRNMCRGGRGPATLSQDGEMNAEEERFSKT